MELLLGVIAIALMGTHVYGEEDVKIVNVMRPDADRQCHAFEVCADVFNFTRTYDDGSRRRESRYIQNCQCSRGECGRSGNQLMFKETLTQAMVTCEPATEFEVCAPGQIAKEQHNRLDYVYYKINCVCPNNEHPGGFRNKMTERRNYYEMDEEQQAYADLEENRQARFYQCRDMF